MRTRDNHERVDVVIVGAGASGSVAARYLAEAGFSVVCLEQGRWFDPSDFPGDKLEWELLGGSAWHPNPNVRASPHDYPCDVSESALMPLMFNGVGGSTLHYGAHWVRFLPPDFRTRSVDGVAEDWPFGYQELVPYYEQVERAMAVSGLGGDPAYPPGRPPPLPAHPIEKSGRRAAEGMNKLGWHWWPASLAIASAPYGGLSQCVRRGTCLSGCPDGAKASTDVALWPAALKHGAWLLTGARVKEIAVGSDGLATGAVYVDRQGRDRLQEASVVILAANGIGTARLLLLSSSSRFRDGLANSSGLVGKGLMMHPYSAVIGQMEDGLESWLGPAGGAIRSLQFYETDVSRGHVRGASWVVLPTGGPLRTLLRAKGEHIDELMGAAFHPALKQCFPRTLEWGIVGEDLPDDANAVTLHAALKDSDGLPAPKVTYRLSDNTREMAGFHISRAEEALRAAGAATVSATPLMPEGTGHLFGTARMGRNRQTSVVDEFGRTHDVPNLYVIDGSIFPTSSGVPPVATICAVALRCVANVIDQASLQKVSA